MSCEICGKSECMRCFHTNEEQEQFDGMKDLVLKSISYAISRIDTADIDDTYWVKLEDVENVISDAE